MRIECEVCNATYTIDDSQLSDQPIGAQCPYCGHVKLVKRGDASASPPPPPPPSAPGQIGDFDSVPFGGGPPGGHAPPGGAPPPFGGETASPFGASPFGGGSPFGGSQEPTVPAAFPSSPPPQGGASLASDLSVPNDSGNIPPPPPGMTSGGGQPFDEPDASCQVCGTPLTDEFDKVIGLCEAHQRDRRSADIDDGPAAPSVANWHVRTPDGRTEGPLTLEDLRARVRSGELSPSADFSNDGINFAPIGRFKEIAYLASLSVGGQVSVAPKGSYAAPRRSMDLSRIVTPLIVLAVIGGLGFVAYSQRDLIERIYQGIVAGPTALGPTGPNPLKRYVANWRLAHPDVSGTADEHLVTARTRHLEDTWNGYQQAEQAYERALLLDESDARAIAGYVENLAVWRFDSASVKERRVAEAAAQYAIDIAADLPDGYRALGSVALAKGDLPNCRSNADKAIEKNSTDARARLLLAECYLEGNVQLAITEASAAHRYRPELRRAERFLALANARIGHYATAIDMLEKRLEVDPDNAVVHRNLGDLYRELAMLEQAEAAYTKASSLEGDKQAALIALAELKMEERQTTQAIRAYDAATQDRPMYGSRAARAYGGWARAELSRRRPERAVVLADKALSYAPKDSVSLLVRGEAALMTNSATTAHAYARRALNARPGEPAALVLQARAFVAQGARESAVKALETAVQNDPRDPRLRGILSGVFLSMGASPQAYAAMRQAAEVDPDEARSRARKGLLSWLDVAVKEAIDQFRRSATEERNASVASSSMAILYYHMGDVAQARTAVDRALRIDGSNVAALLYKAQLALDRGDAATAVQATAKMQAVERGSALGSLLQARAFAKQSKERKARTEFGSALRSNPGLLAAKVELAAMDLEGSNRSTAIGELETAFRVNPNSLTLRRTLLAAGL
ncbi:MAG: tetratricopeptide repeat protein [Deltaproteobacteria bacterium]